MYILIMKLGGLTLSILLLSSCTTIGERLVQGKASNSDDVMGKIDAVVGAVAYRGKKGSCNIMSSILSLSACSSAGEMLSQIANINYDEIDRNRMPVINTTGSIYSSNKRLSLYSDSKASNVGDIITVLLSEKTTASKSANTSTTKENKLDISNPTLFGSDLSMPIPSGLPFGGRSIGLESKLSSSKSFSGEGGSAQSNKINGTIAVLVTHVLPNGNLVISGKKRITINNGDEYLHITGIVRPRDISGNNIVKSNKIANAEISYSGTGIVADVNDNGWLTRFFNSKWWPL